MSIADGLTEVRARIRAAAERAGRDPSGITLIAVSKRHPAAAIREAYALGQRDFGENYVQELVAKRAELADLEDLRFHFIGHLQRNKARAVVRAGASVHTVDSVRLARALGAERAPGTSLDVHVQVNVARDEAKSGCDEAELADVISAAREAGLRVRGLMTIPAVGDAEAARPHFRRLAELAREHGLAELSMGMSADLEVAIAEGTTAVRVGTAIFGDRV